MLSRPAEGAGALSMVEGAFVLNFTEVPVDVGASFPAQTWRRLEALRSAVDPTGLVLANHPVPRLYENGLPTR